MSHLINIFQTSNKSTKIHQSRKPRLYVWAHFFVVETLLLIEDSTLREKKKDKKYQQPLNYSSDHVLAIKLFFVSNWPLNNLINKPVTI